MSLTHDTCLRVIICDLVCCCMFFFPQVLLTQLVAYCGVAWFVFCVLCVVAWLFSIGSHSVFLRCWFAFCVFVSLHVSHSVLFVLLHGSHSVFCVVAWLVCIDSQVWELTIT